jgi:hypothetical protein
LEYAGDILRKLSLKHQDMRSSISLKWKETIGAGSGSNSLKWKRKAKEWTGKFDIG